MSGKSIALPAFFVPLHYAYTIIHLRDGGDARRGL